MLNEDKIRIMSRCAMYEKGQGKEDLAVNRYYQGDYVLSLIHIFRCCWFHNEPEQKTQ